MEETNLSPQTNQPQFSDLYRSVVRIAASDDVDPSSPRIGSGFFVSPSTLLTTWDQIAERTDLIILRGRGFQGPKYAEVLSTNRHSNLACLRLKNGEPHSENFLALAAAFPTQPVPVRLLGYTPSDGGWTCKSWKGRSKRKPQFCSCRRRRCPYMKEERGWAGVTLKMPNCEGGWGGGPIVNAQSKEVISLAGMAMDTGESWQNLAFLLGVNLSRMHDILRCENAAKS